ncbi:MAG: AMP-binding protein [Clostridia bacterium]|nr:AMP-binding protein [Clostridia bacterium]
MKNQVLHEKREFANVRQLIEWAGDTYAERAAYSYRFDPRGEIQTVTFADLRDDVRGLASELLEMGCAGQHCAVVGKFCYDWVVIYFALLSIGAIIVPLDRDWHKEDLATTAEKADVSFLFCEESLAEKAEYVAAHNVLSAPPVYLLAKENERSLTALIASGKQKFAASSALYFSARIDPNTMSLLVFTSGTTGKGKGVMLSQNAVLSDLSDIIPYIDFSQKTVGVLPPHHTYGSSVMMIGHAIIGAEIYISSGIRYVQKEMKEQKPGHLVLVPLYLETFYRKIRANIKEQGKEDLVAKLIRTSNALRKVGIDLRRKLFSSIRAAFGGEVTMIISGGAPINPEILEFFEAIGISTLNGYGITECAPIVAVNRSRNVVPGSVGSVLDIDQVVISDPNEDGEGEICVKGPNVMLGYYRDPEATEAAFDADGYFRTGDYGRLDKDRILYITGRKKNLIILSNGKNVYPEEIENALMATPGLLEIIVYEGQSRRGVSHNAIVAEIYPDREFFEKNGITDIEGYFKPYIAAYNKTAVPYKKISILKVREEEFPKNTLRKIMRFKLDMTID